MFDEIDLDGDGYITAEEMCAGLKKLGAVNMTIQEAEDIVAESDIDKDGRVSYEGEPFYV